MIAGGLAIVGIGQALLTIAAVDSSWTVFLPGVIVACIGTGLFNPALSAVALELGPAADEPASPPASTTRSARPASPWASPRWARSCPPRTRSAGIPRPTWTA